MAVKLDKRRLVKVLGMLGSRHDGEVLAAARLAQYMLGQAKTSWHELLDVKPGDEPEPLPQEDGADPKRKYADPEYADMLKVLLKGRAIDPKSRKKLEVMAERLDGGDTLGLDDKLLVRWLYHTVGPAPAG
jgi:hypothetical protein